MNNKQATHQLILPIITLWSHSDPLKHFLNFLCFNKFHFWVILVGELPSSTYSFPLCFIMYLDRDLVSTSTSMSKESTFTSKILPSTDIDEKYADCSTSISGSTCFFFLYNFSFNLFFFLRITNNDKCRCRQCNLSLKISQCFFKSFSHGGSTL